MVAREYVIRPKEKGDGDLTLRMAMPNSGAQKGALAASLTLGKEELVCVSLVPTGKSSGEGLIRFEEDGKVFGLELTYENYAEKAYREGKMITGTFTVSLYDPDDVLKNAQSSILPLSPICSILPLC